MRYIPNSPEERVEMVKEIGLQTIDELFQTIPERLRLSEPLKLPPAQSESELIAFFRELASRNVSTSDYAVFMGAGAYNHFIPAHVDALISRSEFSTVYTPYQAEISQGTLQAMFEFQTLICQITGMEVASTALYDGSTALAEAVLMAEHITGRSEVLLSASVHPEYREVVANYTRTLGLDLKHIGFDSATGCVNPDSVQPSSATAAVVIQSPNFFGCIEDVEAVAQIAREAGALMIVVVAEPISLGVLRPPGESGADIVVGEGQAFGIPLSFGGPYLGLFATREKFVRHMPGRIVGQAFDEKGRRGFCLTLVTREQYIRREKANSNICTSQELCSLMAAIYLSTMGPQGLREVAIQNVQKAAYAAQRIAGVPGFTLRFSGPRFNEFVVRAERPVKEILSCLRERRIIGGLALERFYPELRDSFLVCVTERVTRDMIERYVEALTGL